MIKCSVPYWSFRIVDLNEMLECEQPWWRESYAIGLALLHLFQVGSPYAVIFLLFPSNSVHRESFLTWSNALLKWLVLLSSEKTSVYMKYATPPYTMLVTVKLLFSPRLAVRIAPTMMKLKLNVCCVALAAFSFPLNSPQGTLPSSLKAVTAFLLGREEAFDVPKPVSVAYNRAAKIGRRLGGHLRRDTGRTREFISVIGIAFQFAPVSRTELCCFQREAWSFMWGSELVRFCKAAWT